MGGGGGGGGGGGQQSTYSYVPKLGGGGGRGGGAVGKLNSSLTCTHSLNDKRVHSAPALSCSTASLTFVRTTE